MMIFCKHLHAQVSTNERILRDRLYPVFLLKALELSEYKYQVRQDYVLEVFHVHEI